MSFSLLLQSADPTASAAGTGLGMFIPLILIMGIMYFFMIRPQNKKQKELQKKLDSLKKGDKVITIGGIHGTIVSTKEGTVVVKVDDNTKIEFNRAAIATVNPEEVKAKESKKAKEETTDSEEKKESEEK